MHRRHCGQCKFLKIRMDFLNKATIQPINGQNKLHYNRKLKLSQLIYPTYTTFECHLTHLIFHLHFQNQPQKIICAGIHDCNNYQMDLSEVNILLWCNKFIIKSKNMQYKPLLILQCQLQFKSLTVNLFLTAHGVGILLQKKK